MSDRGWRWVLGCVFVIQLGLYAWVYDLSNDFEYSKPSHGRPVVLVFGIFTACFALHLIALIAALRLASSRSMWWFLFVGAFIFRLVLLPSEPIQEVDIYRYCWDGFVLRRGVSPFRYSPSRVLSASDEESTLSDDLQMLIRHRDEDRELRQLLSRVHFGELTTIYPPISQVVFAFADQLSPPQSTLALRLLIMKAVIVVFDLATLAMLAKLLSLLKKHVAWVIVYGWSPLVLKEFANSGHLDSIAVAFCIGAVWAAMRWGIGQQHETSRLETSGRSRVAIDDSGANSASKPVSAAWAVAAACLLGLAVGAKLFPVVIAPLMAAWVWRIAGLARSVRWSVVFGSVTIGVMLPMFLAMRSDAPDARPQVDVTRASQTLAANDALPPPPTLTESSEIAATPIQGESANAIAADAFTEDAFTEDATTGEVLATELPQSVDAEFEGTNDVEAEAPPLPNDDGLIEFLSRWEMNDLLFMVVEENLRPSYLAQTNPWFVIVPAGARNSVIEFLEARSGIEGYRIPFLATRVLTSIVFFLIAIGLSIRMVWSASVPVAGDGTVGDGTGGDGQGSLLLGARFLESTCWTLAWFWLFSPTQNPWYWTWVLPFVPFARNRIWLAVGGLAMIYYLRFYFRYELHDVDVWGWGYVGSDFYDFVVVAFEFGPWLFALLVTCCWRRLRGKDGDCLVPSGD